MRQDFYHALMGYRHALEAGTLLSSLQEAVATVPYNTLHTDLLEQYKLLLKYFSEGVDDSLRHEIYLQLAAQTIAIKEEGRLLRLRESMPSHPHTEYMAKRESTLPIGQLFARMEELSDDMERQPVAYFSASEALFDRLAFGAPLAKGDREALLFFLRPDADDPYRHRTFIPALYMALLWSYDPVRIEALVRCAIEAPRGTHQIALTALMLLEDSMYPLVSQTYPEIAAGWQYSLMNEHDGLFTAIDNLATTLATERLTEQKKEVFQRAIDDLLPGRDESSLHSIDLFKTLSKQDASTESMAQLLQQLSPQDSLADHNYFKTNRLYSSGLLRDIALYFIPYSPQHPRVADGEKSVWRLFIQQTFDENMPDVDKYALQLFGKQQGLQHINEQLLEKMGNTEMSDLDTSELSSLSFNDTHPALAFLFSLYRLQMSNLFSRYFIPLDELLIPKFSNLSWSKVTEMERWERLILRLRQLKEVSILTQLTDHLLATYDLEELPPSLRKMMSVVCYDLEWYEEAIDLLTSLPHEHDPVLQRRIGDLFGALGEEEEMAKYYELSLQHNPQQPEMGNRLSSYYMKEDRYEEASRVCMLAYSYTKGEIQASQMHPVIISMLRNEKYTEVDKMLSMCHLEVRDLRYYALIHLLTADNYSQGIGELAQWVNECGATDWRTILENDLRLLPQLSPLDRLLILDTLQLKTERSS